MYFSFLLWAFTSAAIQPGFSSSNVLCFIAIVAIVSFEQINNCHCHCVLNFFKTTCYYDLCLCIANVDKYKADFQSLDFKSNQIKFIFKHKILKKTQTINKKWNKWEKQVQTGVLAGLKGRETALRWAPRKSKQNISNYMQLSWRLTVCYFYLGRGRSIAISVSVCLSVCLSICLLAYFNNLQNFTLFFVHCSVFDSRPKLSLHYSHFRVGHGLLFWLDLTRPEILLTRSDPNRQKVAIFEM